MKKKQRPLKHRLFSETLILVGLGNPGPAYTETRHNVGFLCVEALAEKEAVHMKKPFFANYLIGEFVRNNTRVILVKPLTFMNRSGIILAGILKKYGVSSSQLLIAVDNMDLPPGHCRLRLKGSSAGHNGLKSIMAELNQSDFMRLYIGVGRPDKGSTVIDHVLGTPGDHEKTDFLQGITKAGEALYAILENGAAGAMNGINRKLS